MNNRILAMLLAIIMIVSIVPVNADATTNVHGDKCPFPNPCICPGGQHIAHNLSCSHGPCNCIPDDGSNDQNNGGTVTPPEHTHKDETGPNGVPNGICDISGCTDHVHKKQDVAAVVPSCTVGGNLAYSKCEFCGKILDENGNEKSNPESDYILNPDTVNGHKLTLVEAVPNTCKEIGNVAYYVCELCGGYFDATTKASIANKDEVKYASLAQHTWKSGYFYTDETGHYQICSVCDAHSNTNQHNTFKYENGKKVCGHCGYAYDHECKDTSDCKCDECLSEMEHDIGWHSNDAGKHFQKCKNETCFKKQLTEWEDCTDADKDCKCDDCGYEFDHQFGNGYSYTDASGHYKVCTVCGEHGNTISHNTFKYENGKKICGHCGYEYDHECVDTYAGGNHKCDECGSEMEHDLEWVIGTDNHYQQCKFADCYFKEESKTEKKPHADKDDNCKCDDCGKQMEHEFSRKYTYTDGVFHYQECKCGAQQHKLYHSFVYEDTKDGKQHVKKCKVCDYSVTQDHTDENGNHSCDVCDAELAHNVGWKNNGQGKHYQYCQNDKCYKKTLSDWAECTDENNDCKCDDCGAQLAHNLKTVERVEAKCGIAGNKGYKVCETCGALFNLAGGAITEEDIAIPALQHKWWPKGLDLTGTLHTEMCEYCKIIRFKSHFDNTGDCMCDYDGCTAPAHEHTIVHVLEKTATCTEEGHQEYWLFKECGKEFADAACTQPLTQKVIYGKTAHNATDWAPTEDGSKHEQECRVCGELLATEEHDFSTEAPYCADCGMPEGLEFVDEEPASCTERGVKAHYKSRITQRRYWDAAGTRYISNVNDLVIPVRPHAWEVVTSDGVNHVIGCENCSAEYVEECESTDGNCACDICGMLQPGHTMAYVEGKAATCTKNGVRASWYCAKCDKYYDAHTLEYLPTIVIPALGHRFTGSWYNDVREGGHSRNCIRCSEKITEAHELEVEDTLKGNLHEGSCTVCDYIETGIHTYTNGDSICDECGHDRDVVVSGSDMDNHSNTVTIKVKKDEEGNRGISSFLDRLKPSYVGESETSVDEGTQIPGSGVSSGSSVPGTGSTGTSTGTSAVGAVIQYLMNLLRSMFG